MADILKILGQLDAAAATPESLYLAPDLSSVTVSTLVVCNQTALPLSFRVSALPAGEIADPAQYLFFDTPLDGNSTLTATLGITLAEGDQIMAYASSTGLSFNLFGVETT